MDGGDGADADGWRDGAFEGDANVDGGPGSGDGGSGSGDGGLGSGDGGSGTGDGGSGDGGSGTGDGGSGSGDGGSGTGDGGSGSGDGGSGTGDGGSGSGDGGSGTGDGGSGSGDGGSGTGDGGAGSDGGASGADGGGLDANSGDGDVSRIPDIKINEAVIYPVHDWNRSDGAGIPFSGRPGTGLISANDEYIELYNADTESVDLRGWTIELIDATPTVTPLEYGAADFVTSDGADISSFAPGTFLLIGNPQGFTSTDVLIVLRDSLGRKVDEVEIGGFIASRDFGRDGADGAPSPDRNGFARGAFEEAIARSSDGLDTDDDALDFVAMIATPLGPNITPPPPVESIPPFVVSYTTGGFIPVTGPIRIQFSETLDAGSTDEAVQVLDGATGIPLDPHTFEQDDTILVINPVGRYPFATTLQIQVAGGSQGIRDLAGNPMTQSLSFTVFTEAAPPNPANVLLNEVCADPLQDWGNDAGGDGIGFSSTPGTGRVSSEDEWIELLVRTGAALDLSGYYVNIYNGFNLFGPAQSATSLTDSVATIRFFGSGGSVASASSGDRVVIGNPRGSISVNTFIELRDNLGQLIDFVEIGGNQESSDRGGDGISNGAPGAGLNATSSTEADEVVARQPDGNDTGSDTEDWDHGTATLGSAN